MKFSSDLPSYNGYPVIQPRACPSFSPLFIRWDANAEKKTMYNVEYKKQAMHVQVFHPGLELYTMLYTMRPKMLQV